LTHHFCTYFDVNFLSRGLALFHSLRTHCPCSFLWVLCLDEETHVALNRLRLPGLYPISLKEFEHEDAELLAFEHNRSRVEYYFTCTPSLLLYVLCQCLPFECVTYLDADLFFFSDPQPLFEEMSGGSVAIIAHRFPEKLRHLEKFGVYNVGWLSFRRDADALTCLYEWRMQCIEWCYDREENGRFADQKYLDAWPSRFPGVVVLSHPGANVAPWNLADCRMRLVGGQVLVEEQPLIFFHFHGFKFSPQTGYDFNLKAYGARVTPLLGQQVFFPYVRALTETSQTAARLSLPNSLCSGVRQQGNDATRTAAEELPPPQLNPEKHAHARGLRGELARFWLKTPAADLAAQYSGKVGDLHKKIANGPIKGIPLSNKERELVRQASELIRPGAGEEDMARFFLVTTLYLNPHELPPDFDPISLPEWLGSDAFYFQLNVPSLLDHRAETEAICTHLQRVIERLHGRIRSNSPPPASMQMAVIFAEKASLQPLYFSRRNLKEIATRRADIVDYVTRLKGQELEYTPPPWDRRKERIRLGIHCFTLRAHTETYATLPIFMHLDPKHFDVHIYIHHSDGNAIEQRTRRLAKRFTVLPETLKACVETLRADDLDILVFGNNITAGAGYAFNIANYRMARVQCIHFCNPVSSGKRNVDQFIIGKLITDNLAIQEHFSEKILSVDGSGICFDLPDSTPKENGDLSRQTLRIPGSSTVFISGANYFKIIPELRHTWAKVLAKVPGSVLMLYPFGPAWSHQYPKQRFLESLTHVFNQYGIHSERLIVMDTLKQREEILDLNRIADIYLDAVPYNGATSLLDPLKEGVPSIVVDGRELRFSQGAAILRELGVPELITYDEDGYIRLAVQLALDADMRAAIRRRIRERMDAVPDFLNPALYARRVAQAFCSLFQKKVAPALSLRSRVAASTNPPQA
jgi:predicted O-linked N-acetylglucosamine transferase (SPINDLY family)